MKSIQISLPKGLSKISRETFFWIAVGLALLVFIVFRLWKNKITVRPELEKVFEMNPKIGTAFEMFLRDIEAKGGKVTVTSTVRSYEDQVRIWSEWQAKVDAGLIAKNPASYPSKDKPNVHTRGEAMDINVEINGISLRMASPKSDWMPIVELSKKYNFRWGGNFSAYDPVHFDIVGSEEKYK